MSVVLVAYVTRIRSHFGDAIDVVVFSPRRLEPRAAALGHSHGVLFDVVVMSSMLDYYLSCIYRCIALQPNILSTLIICSLSQ